MFCYGVYVLLWSICSAVEYMFCYGVYVLLWSICSAVEYTTYSAVEYIFSYGIYVPKYFATAHYSDLFFASGVRI
jgi:hypothetical protein